MLPISLIFTSGVASGVNSYAAVLVLGLLGRFGHIAAIPPVLERPSVLAAAAVLFIGQFVVGKIPMLDSAWDVAHTALRPVVGGAVGVIMAEHEHHRVAVDTAGNAAGEDQGDWEHPRPSSRPRVCAHSCAGSRPSCPMLPGQSQLYGQVHHPPTR